nr:MAG TPA: hypothetical protein [Caudoviricetes sp.]
MFCQILFHLFILLASRMPFTSWRHINYIPTPYQVRICSVVSPYSIDTDLIRSRYGLGTELARSNYE